MLISSNKHKVSGVRKQKSDDRRQRAEDRISLFLTSSGSYCWHPKPDTWHLM